MPLYEYKCSKCEEIFEVIQKFSDVPLKKHVGCGGKVEKLMSAPAFQLKGTGWYATDYKKQQPPAAKTGEKTDTKGDAKSESKGESKSEGNGDKPSSTASETKTDTKSDAKPAAAAPAKSKKE